MTLGVVTLQIYRLEKGVNVRAQFEQNYAAVVLKSTVHLNENLMGKECKDDPFSP
jgi:hypothetical protein